MRKRIVTGLAALAAFVAVVSAPPPAQADSFGPAAGLWYTDNSTLTYCFTDGFTSFRAVGDYAMSVIDSTTDLTSQFPTTPQFCEFRETDIWWWSTNLPAGVRGQMWCEWEAPWDPDICKSDDIDMDFAELDIGDLDWEDRRKTAVHELGHCVGLPHNTGDGAGSAMISGEIPDAGIQYRRYSQHHINHINARY